MKCFCVMLCFVIKRILFCSYGSETDPIIDPSEICHTLVSHSNPPIPINTYDISDLYPNYPHMLALAINKNVRMRSQIQACGNFILTVVYCSFFLFCSLNTHVWMETQQFPLSQQGYSLFPPYFICNMCVCT